MNRVGALEPIRSVVFRKADMARRVILVVGVQVPATIARKLMSEGFTLVEVATGSEAHAFTAERLPVAVLVRGDLATDAVGIVPYLRQEERFAFVQVFVSPAPSSIAAAIRDGADDVFETIDDDAAERIVARIHRASALARLALLDPLTQLHNRRFMNDRLRAEVARAVRARTTFSVALIDLDSFKPVNDEFGHAAGDRVLIAFATALRRDLRAYDVACRFGGDEFVVLFPDCDGSTAQNVLNDFRTRAGWALPGLPLVQFSAGVAQFPDDGDEWARLFNVADRRAFAAKRMGGNQTSIT